MRTLVVGLALAGCAAAPSGDILRMEADVMIDAPVETVFDFAADPLNDIDWRRETLDFEADGPPALGTRYVETIDIGLRNGYRMEVEVVGFEPSRQVRVAALPDMDRVFAAERVFAPEGSGTRVTYVVDAEDRVVRDISVVPVPFWLAEVLYEADMRAYLRALRDRLEDDKQAQSVSLKR